MRHGRIAFSPLLAAALAGCATAGQDVQNEITLPRDVAEVRTFWVGERPPCGMVPVREVYGDSENALRWAAAESRANAVVNVRSRYVRTNVRLGYSRVFWGVAVRLGKCGP